MKTIFKYRILKLRCLTSFRSALTVSLLILISTAALSGCGSLNASSTDEKVFNYVNVDEPKHLDPALSATVYEGIVNGLMFDGLVNFGKGTELEPGLAEKWEVSPDGMTCTFHLRDAAFSDGTTVTAADVRHSLTRLLIPDTGSDRKWVAESIQGSAEVTSGTTKELKGIETPDDKTVVIRLSRPDLAFLTKLAMPAGGIVPARVTDTDQSSKDFDKKPVGTGPWKLHKWTRDMRIEFMPNAHYWGPRPNLDRFNYSVQVDDTVQRQQFKIGKFDIYPSVGFTVYGQWNKDPEYKDRLLPLPELNTYYIGIVSTKPALQDKRVRQAIAHAIDTKGLFEKVQLGRGQLAHGPVPAGIEGHRPGLKPREYNPERAKELLKEAGVENLALNLWIRTEAQTDEKAAAIQADLAKVGIKCQINKRDHAAMNEATYSGQPDLFLWSWWLDYPDIENALEPCFHSRNIPRQGNRAHFSNAEMDRVLDEARNETDAKRRMELFQKAEDIVMDEVPWIPLYHRKSYAVSQPWVTGYEPSLMYNANRYTTVDIDLSKKK